MRRVVADRVYIVNLLGLTIIHVYAYGSHYDPQAPTLSPATTGAASMLNAALCVHSVRPQSLGPIFLQCFDTVGWVI